MTNNHKELHKRAFAGIGIVGLSSILVAISTLYPKNKALMNSSMTMSQSSQSLSVNQSVNYKNGSYMAKGSYFSPGGKEYVTVSIDISNNKIAQANVTSGANDPTAVSYQTLFIGNFKQYIIGKRIDSIKLRNVAGSSLTSQGFNKALTQIEAMAKV